MLGHAGWRPFALYQGTTLVGPPRVEKDLGFSPCKRRIPQQIQEVTCRLSRGTQGLIAEVP